jgi:hypothetical protein
MNLKRKYDLQRRGAGYRGIAFLLTYDEWLSIWRTSGKLSQRGRKGHQYVMARYGDVGPYAIGNVKIIRQSENLSEGHIGMVFSAEARQKMSAAWRPRTKATFKKISRALKGKSKSDTHREALSIATIAAQTKMRLEGRHIGRPKRSNA